MLVRELCDKNGISLSAGDIFVWEDFPYQIDGEIKRRYFVFFGRTGAFAFSFMFYMRTTTTQEHETHRCVELLSSEIKCLPRDCRIDFGYRMNSFPPDVMDKFSCNIEMLGKLPEHKVREIINKIEKHDKYISKIEIKEIRESFSRAGYSFK